jgi:toxin CcdB
MARFDLHRNRLDETSLLLDVQSDFLSHLDTRLVIPALTLARIGKRIPQLHLTLQHKSKTLYLATNLMAAVQTHQLGSVVDNIEPRSHEIVAAIDFLMQGF